MKEKIKKYLSDLEKKRGIEILIASETGSRSWGFPSPDSDYDVRIIYKHELDWYLSLNEEKDTIEYFLDNNEIDISGWDIRKTLRLLWKSNPPLLERIQSPIIYKNNDIFLVAINKLAKKSYSRIATIHHYLSMAKKYFEQVETSKEYKLKKFFYALRCSIACLWILEKDEIPPIEFSKMYNQLNLSDKIKNRINELIELKAGISETYLHTGEQEILDFMGNCIKRADIESKELPASNRKMSEFNEFFRNIIRK